MSNSSDWNDRLHEQMTAIARERDNSNRRIALLDQKIQELEDALELAHEALRREMP
jgi:hypothetical protein